MRKKKFRVKSALETKAGKYFVANRIEGKTKKEAQEIAGYAGINHSNSIEETATYKALANHYKDELLDQIPLNEIAQAHAENIRQNKDLSARNTAIKMAYDKIEPPNDVKEEKEDRVIVILSKEEKPN